VALAPTGSASPADATTFRALIGQPGTVWGLASPPITVTVPATTGQTLDSTVTGLGSQPVTSPGTPDPATTVSRVTQPSDPSAMSWDEPGSLASL
jgi:hypothetical protein